MDQREPHQLFAGVLLGVEEDLQQMDRGDGDDGGRDLDLERADVDLAEPMDIVALVETGDEILVARDDHHDDEAGDQGGVDQAEHFEDGLGIVEREQVRREFPELVAEGDGIERERDAEADIEDHQQPARGEDDAFDEQFQTLHTALAI